MPERYAYSYKVLADDKAAGRLEEPTIPSWSSLYFDIKLHVRNIVKDVDEHGGSRSVYVDPPLERNLTFRCVELCRKREDFRDDGVFKEASEIMTSILDTITGHVVPSSKQEAIAGEFGRLACRMLQDERYVRCRQLPTIVAITVFSARPMISRLLSRPPEPACAATIKALERCRQILSGASEGEETCPICLAEIPAQSVITRLPCSHFFHEECIVGWLRINRICPFCCFILPQLGSTPRPSGTS